MGIKKEHPESSHQSPPPVLPSRRRFFSQIFMFVALGLSYGLFGAMALKFLRPRREKKRFSKMFVTFVDELSEGGSFSFETPKGERFLLTRRDDALTAFSSLCPHLGCKVHWEMQAKQYLCPCHAGVFDANGIAIAGPPAKAGQKLKACEIKLEGKAIYAMVEP